MKTHPSPATIKRWRKKFEAEHDTYYTELKVQKKKIEHACRKGKISEEFYNSNIKELEKKLKDREAVHEMRAVSIKCPDIRNEHFIIELNCPCGYKGTVAYGKMDFKLLGKDRKGFLYFACPKCQKHLKYDPIENITRVRKGILGFWRKI